MVVFTCIVGIRWFYNEMRYINLRFTYLLTYGPVVTMSSCSKPPPKLCD